MQNSHDPMLPELFRIQNVRRETADTFTMTFEAVDGQQAFRFRAGQFNMLYLFGVGEIPISISGDPTRPGALVHTTRAVGTVTRALKRLRPGDLIGIRGPFGSAWPVQEAEGADVVIVAGGIGLAPLRPVMYTVLARREKYGRIVLMYGTRTPEDILFRRELETWRGKFDLDVYVTVDRAMGRWRGHVGVVTTLIRKATFDPHSTVAMVCGPEIMMRYSVLELHRRGVPLSAVYISMERNMKCAVGFCGHCQFGPHFICKDGPVFRYDRVQNIFLVREV